MSCESDIQCLKRGGGDSAIKVKELDIIVWQVPTQCQSG
nr:hypothetical protein ELOWGMBK_ELOWGMBK_CDS_0015 [Herelleviridae sp.]CAI9751968.1 hypothetical protein QGKEIAJE_QGKEIAJE_CDS_0014 [uncultured phage]